jgi:hypothetical protein
MRTWSHYEHAIHLNHRPRHPLEFIYQARAPRIMSDSSNTALVLSFGIITLLATLAGLHYRDSLCCLCCRSLIRAWRHSTFAPSQGIFGLTLSEGAEFDLEAAAGLQRSSSGTFEHRDSTVIELQPRRALPLYLDASGSEPNMLDHTSSVA